MPGVEFVLGLEDTNGALAYNTAEKAFAASPAGQSSAAAAYDPPWFTTMTANSVSIARWHGA
jgi:hypothetical protein